MIRQGSAEWKGGLKDGHGTVSTESETLDYIPYSFQTRFEEGKGTNPEELIASAHAGCFSMAFAAELEKAGFKSVSIVTLASVSLEKTNTGFSIPSIHLKVSANVPSIDEDTFQKMAIKAKEGCPVSKLMNANITLDASCVN